MKLPIGIQTFEEIINNDYVYVDKTENIHRIITSGKYYFFSRPRRFGKSLLLSTMKSIYEGKKELFKGLWIENNRDWTRVNNVLHFRFSSQGINTLGLEKGLLIMLSEEAKRLNIRLEKESYDLQFQELIIKAATNRKVVVLIDEYDKPIIDHLDNLEQAVTNRQILKRFYSILKDADPYLELVFITGVSRFAKTSIFSDLNNLTNLTLDDETLSLLGFTYEEVAHYFDNQLHKIAKKNKTTFEETVEKMRFWYNGYSWNGDIKVYNPFSLLQFMRSGRYNNYWFDSGTPTFLTNQLRKQRVHKIENTTVSDMTLSSYDLEFLNPYTLLFQTGYLTIKSIPANGIFELDYPNNEVKISLEEHLLNAFSHDRMEMGKTTAYHIAQALKVGNIEAVIDFLNATFASLPYQLWQKENEAFYHAIIHLSMSLMGVYIQSELTMATGRLDAKVTTDDAIYILEFKLGKSAEIAIQQIEEKGYFKPHQNSGKKLIGVGINFSKEVKEINDWSVKEF